MQRLWLCSEKPELCGIIGGTRDKWVCKTGAHIVCGCKRETKVPIIELTWLRHQRDKTGEKSNMGMSTSDKVEEKKMEKKEQGRARRLKLKEGEEKRKKLCEEASAALDYFTCGDIDIDESEDGEKQEDIDDIEPSLADVNDEAEAHLSGDVNKHMDGGTEADAGSSKRNMMPITHTSAASVRFGTSDGATAAIASGFLRDLIDAGHLSPSMSYLALDRSKVSRGKESVIRTAKGKGDEDTDSKNITAVFFDGRKDKTKTLLLNSETNRYHQKTIIENHISVTSEPDGQYRFHFTPEPSDRKNKPAKMIAIGVHNWMVENGVDKTVLVLGGDSTNEMSGKSGGSLTWVEKLLGRKTFWVICVLHTNELPLRHLITSLDGKTSSKDGFSGPIGKLLSHVNTMPRKSFEAIPGTEELIELPEKVLKDMSTDAALSYQLLGALRDGELSSELASRKCGNIVHSRWLTTGQSLMMLYMSDHHLTGEDLRKLNLIVNFVANVYLPMFYEIKVKHSILDGPKHILTLLRLLRGQPQEVLDIVSHYVGTGAWFAHSEAILLSMLASPNVLEREFAVEKVLSIRRGEEYGNKQPRTWVKPDINFDATTLQDLIDWDGDKIHEPVFSCDLSRQQIKDIVDNQLQVDNYPLHTQSTERAVKLVSLVEL